MLAFPPSAAAKLHRGEFAQAKRGLPLIKQNRSDLKEVIGLQDANGVPWFQWFGNLNNGANAGLRYANLNNGLSRSRWNNCARVSENKINLKCRIASCNVKRLTYIT